MNNTSTDHDVTPAGVLATVKTLRARARKIPALRRTAHHQIAMRRIRDAELFAERNTLHAVSCCWEARFHLGHCE